METEGERISVAQSDRIDPMATEKRVEGSDGHAAPTPENLLSDNARRVFSEPDGAKRISALQELWFVDGMLFEDTSIAIGHEARPAG